MADPDLYVGGAMRFCVLGPVEVAGGGRQVSLGSRSQRAILAVMLALRGEIVSPDRLIDTVWGSQPPASARKSLHSHVSRLRRALTAVAPDGKDALETVTDGYRLEPEHGDVDADRFDELVAHARQALYEDPARSVTMLDEALGLWRGEAFGEFAACEVVRPEAVRLNELRTAAMADRMDARLALGDHHDLIGELEGALHQDPLAERPHAQLMLALYRSGRQADALTVYQRLQHRLSEELGIDPGPELQSLYERILRQDRDLTVRESAAPNRPGPVTAVAAELIGRDEDLAAVAELVVSASLVTLTGPGGVGKSRLAEAVAASVRRQFRDGAAMCGLAAVSDPASVVDALTDAIGARHSGHRSPEETLLAALGTRRLLLVLDNCEHLLGPVATLAARINSACPNVTILATSREILHLPGERVWDVAPLAVPNSGASAKEVAQSPAGSLFCTRAHAAEPAFALTEANAPTVAELCRRLDGVPLAIELAAARVRALSPSDLLTRIDRRFELLTSGPHRESDRHRTLQAVVDWSYGSLDDRQSHLFDRLSVFAGRFPLVAAEQVCVGDPLAEHEVAGALAGLVDKSMVVADHTEAGVHYRLLDTLRTYGAHRLEQSGTADSTRSAHADYHVRLVEEFGPRVRGRDERDALARIDAAVDDLRTATTWCVEAGDVDRALRTPAALFDHLWFGPRAEVFGWAERAVRMPGAGEHPAYPPALATIARGAVNQGDLARARRDAEAALRLAGAEDLTAIWALYVLTSAALYEGRFADALELADRRIRLAVSIGDDYHRALAGVSQVLAHSYRGEITVAVRVAAEALDAAEAAGNHTARAWVMYSHGEALLDAEPDRAADLLEQAIDAARQVDRHLIEGVALVSLASLTGRHGPPDRALALFRETVAHWRRLGDTTHQLTTLRNLVDLLARLGADRAAAVLYGAVTVGATPSFGAEADRLEAAWAQVDRRLGSDAAEAEALRGRHQPLAETVDEVLSSLDALLDQSAQPLTGNTAN